MRKVALGSTFYFLFTTRQFSTGAPFALAGTPDLSVIEDNSGTPIDTGATVATGHASVTGLNLATVIATAANGYEAGKTYTAYIDAGTVDSVSVVGEVVYEFQIETAAELAAREYNEKMFPNHLIATTTSNDTTHINFAEIVDADTDDDEINGEVVAVWDATDGQIVLARVTDYVKSTTLATVETLRSTALPFTVAANDMVWRLGVHYTAKDANLAALATAASVTALQTPLPPTNVALSNIPVYMVDGNGDPVTGLTLTATRSIDGGAFASATGTAAEISAGCYQFDASQADMNGGVIIFKFAGTGAKTSIVPIVTDAAY